ncbi:MAG: FAD-dependent thymidylate synthase [Halanaerobiales bacterium]|nr:FAD-dependent thymidylate synthase [Halanaerobiales bacterium]
MNISYIGEGKVVLLAGGGKIFTDLAARFVKSERSLDEIIASPYSKELVKKILNSGHKAAVEFDFFIFGIEGYSRVTEVQLVRKRLASYMIKTGRANKNGKRSYDLVIPESIKNIHCDYKIAVDNIFLRDGTSLSDYLPQDVDVVIKSFDTKEILNLLELWYDTGVHLDISEEDLRYLKPQATEFKALIGMNAHSLIDWFSIRCCKNAQAEIRDLANKMLILCKQVAPDLFEEAGPNCKILGYCPENEFQHKDCRNKVITKKQALEVISKANWKTQLGNK